MNSRERVLTALRRGMPDRIPWVEHSVAPTIRAALMGCEPEQADWIEFAQFIGLDAVTYMGLQPMYVTSAATSSGHSRSAGGGLHSRDDWSAWVQTWPDPRSPAHFADLERFIARVRRTDLAVAYVGALAVDLVIQSWGIERFAYLLADEPAFVLEMLDRITEWNLIFHEELCRRDLDFLYTGHDLTHNRGTFLSRRFLHREVFPREMAVAKQITLPWIYHCCGNFSSIAEELIAHGCSALDPFQPECMDIVAFKKQYGHRVAVKGNVSLYSLMLGTPDEVEAEVRDKLARLAPGGGYIISSAHSLYGDCQPDNVARMAAVIRNQ